MYTFKAANPVVVHSLEYLKDNIDDKAGQYLSANLRFEFIIALVVAEHILSGTVALTTFLQSTKCDLVQAISESRVVVKQLHDERNDPFVWQALYDNAVEIAEEFEINPYVPRRTGRQIHRASHPFAVPLEYWKVSLYYVFLDHLLQEIETRILQSESQFVAEYIIPAKLHGLTCTTLCFWNTVLILVAVISMMRSFLDEKPDG